MTLISPTEAEPLCDIAAQISALFDPLHPKRAVWISDGTEFVMVEDADLDSLTLPGKGTLYASAHDCGRLADDPSEELLAALLDYTEPKSGIIAQPAVWWPVVQARDRAGCVVWEQIASWQRIREAVERARLYGQPGVYTMDTVRHRRARLIASAR